MVDEKREEKTGAKRITDQFIEFHGRALEAYLHASCSQTQGKAEDNRNGRVSIETRQNGSDSFDVYMRFEEKEFKIGKVDIDKKEAEIDKDRRKGMPLYYNTINRHITNFHVSTGYKIKDS